jgi:hypothetical protein
MPSSEVNEEAEKDGECVESRLHICDCPKLTNMFHRLADRG